MPFPVIHSAARAGQNGRDQLSLRVHRLLAVHVLLEHSFGHSVAALPFSADQIAILHWKHAPSTAPVASDALCEHKEDYSLYSINYNHFGASKVWYVLPPADAGRFEGMMNGLFPAEFAKCKSVACICRVPYTL